MKIGLLIAVYLFVGAAFAFAVTDDYRKPRDINEVVGFRVARVFIALTWPVWWSGKLLITFFRKAF